VGKPLARLAFRPRVRGREHLAAGGFVLGANHLSGFDSLALAFALYPRAFRSMAKVQLFERPLLGRLVRSLGAFPARGGDEPGGAVATAARLARWGEPVVIFPAGARLCKDPRAAAAYRRGARRDPGRRSRPYLDRSADPQPSRSPLARVPRIDSRSAGAGPTRSGRGASQGPPPHRRASCIGRARAL
jgi:1-acyl-sn-glycerol-3-phosphate acyltransferase